MDLSRKIAAALGAVALATTGLSCWTLSQAVRSDQDVSGFQTRRAVTSSAVADLHADFFGYDGQLNMYVLVGAAADPDTTLMADTYDQTQAARAGFAEHLATARKLTDDPQLTASLDQISTAIEQYDGFARQVRTAVQGHRIEQATRLQTVDNLTASNALMDALAAATGRSQALAAADLADLHHRQSMVLVSSGALAGWVIVTLLAIGWFVARSLRPLHRIETGLDALADGDLTEQPVVHSDDEIGRMSAAMARAVAHLNATMTAIADNTSTLAAASEELSSNADQIGSVALDTSGRAENVAASARLVNGSVRGFSMAADELGTSIREIAQNTAESARVAAAAVDLAEQTTGTVNRLGVASTEISGVVELITAVAAQTNLLALNATIEAARAGEAGRGFAVVANEVKDLAQQTAQATSEISRRIEEIQTETGDAVQAISQIGLVVSQINDFQASIAGAVEEQTATAAEMARGVAEAAQGSDDITVAIDGVAEAARSTTGSVTESQQASGELARMSAALQDLVGQFRL